jgi:hypothetical protein
MEASLIYLGDMNRRRMLRGHLMANRATWAGAGSRARRRALYALAHGCRDGSTRAEVLALPPLDLGRLSASRRSSSPRRSPSLRISSVPASSTRSRPASSSSPSSSARMLAPPAPDSPCPRPLSTQRSVLSDGWLDDSLLDCWIVLFIMNSMHNLFRFHPPTPCCSLVSPLSCSRPYRAGVYETVLRAGQPPASTAASAPDHVRYEPALQPSVLPTALIRPNELVTT